MRRRRRKFIISEEQNEQSTLQITSMADIFVIILVFLLKSYASGMVNVEPSRGITLPSLSAPQPSEFVEGLKLEVLSNAILIDQKPILKLNNFEFIGEVSSNSEELFKNFEREKSKEQTLKRDTAREQDASAKSSIIVMADQLAPYSTLKVIMTAAANAGYDNLRLVVLGEN